MAHCNTVLSQIASFLPRHEFEKLAKIYHVGQKFRSYSRWSQFTAMLIAQVTGRKSLRDVESSLVTQKRRCYHLGASCSTRATLARVNEKQPAELYRQFFYKILQRCRSQMPRHKFEFKGKIYLLDATTIDLCLSLFTWAKFRQTKGAIKLHFGLDIDGYLPAFMDLTNGKKHESDWAKALTLHPGSCVVFDKGFNDYSWYESLTKRKILFVTRLKKNAAVLPFGNRRVVKDPSIRSDQKVKLKGYQTDYRIVEYQDPESRKTFQYLTNALKMPATEVAALYKERWKIEQFFRWIKQNLKVKTFLGTSRNAVLTQIWISLCVYLLLSYFKYLAKIGATLTQILRILQLNLFERRSLMDLFKPPDNRETPVSPQLVLWRQV
jgi:hypothetical protein